MSIAPSEYELSRPQFFKAWFERTVARLWCEGLDTAAIAKRMTDSTPMRERVVTEATVYNTLARLSGTRDAGANHNTNEGEAAHGQTV